MAGNFYSFAGTVTNSHMQQYGWAVHKQKTNVRVVIYNCKNKIATADKRCRLIRSENISADFPVGVFRGVVDGAFLVLYVTLSVG